LKRFCSLFLVFEVILYVSFLIMDIVGGGSTAADILKYISIICCGLISFYLYFFVQRNAVRLYICVAMFFTVTADFFLLFTENLVPGLISFSVVQSVYLVLLNKVANRTPKVGRLENRGKIGRGLYKRNGLILLLRVLAAALAGAFLKTVDSDNALLLTLVVFYALSFISNIIFAAGICFGRRHGEDELRVGVFLAALILFALCDINVLLYNAKAFVAIDSEWFNAYLKFAGTAMWLFYLPSQVMIVLSVRHGRGK